MDPIGVACEGCGAAGGEACRLRVAWDPPGRVCDRQAAQVRALDDAANDLLAAAAVVNARIARCHEIVACSKCGAQVGDRCIRVTRAGTPTRGATPLKHPHRERWTLVQAPR